MEITFGRSDENTVQLRDDATISRKHAKGIFDGNSILIESIGRASVEINGERRKSGKVYKSDTLKIGNTFVNLINLFGDLTRKNRSGRSEFIKEFNLLIPKFKQYEKEKNKISDGSNKTNQIVKILVTIVVLITIFFGDVPDNLKYPLMIGAGLFGGVFSIFSSSSGKKKEKLDLLHAEYEHDLVCPKCEKSLINRVIAYYKKRKVCPYCNAIFFR